MQNQRLGVRQQGATMWSTLAIVLMVGFIAFLAFKLMFVYIDHSIIRGSMQEIANQNDFDRLPKSDIRRSIMNRMTIDNIRDMPKDFFKVKEDRSGHRVIHVEYEIRISIAGNVSAVVNFNDDITADKN